MPAHVEREFKLRIPSEEALRALGARLEAPAAGASQVNHFFDTAARDLRRAHIALRMREEDGTSTLALKGPQLSGPAGLAAREEVELQLEPETARAVLDGSAAPLDLLAGGGEGGTHPLVRHARALVAASELQHLGAFLNDRRRAGPHAFPPGTRGPALVFELDRTRFPGGIVERELEVELPEGADADAVRRGLEALFAELGIAAEPAPSKAERFFGILDGPR